MLALFYISSAVAIAATVMTITRAVIVHALLYLVVSLLAVALVFYSLGAPFAAALEVIVYAGAIMVLFVFVVMMLNLGKRAAEVERAAMRPAAWIGPSILALVLIVELVAALARGHLAAGARPVVDPRSVALALYGPYVIGVELASFLLLGGLVGAYHLGAVSERRREGEVLDDIGTDAARADRGGGPVRVGTDGTSRAA